MIFKGLTPWFWVDLQQRLEICLIQSWEGSICKRRKPTSREMRARDKWVVVAVVVAVVVVGCCCWCIAAATVCGDDDADF